MSPDALPAAAAPVPTTAYQRAPTLVSGGASGDQSVRVWSPDPWLLRWRALVSLLTNTAYWLFFFVMICAPLGLPPFPRWLRLIALICGTPVWLVSLVLGVDRFRALAALFRPCYISADGRGLAVAAPAGSRTMIWGDIEGVISLSTRDLLRLCLTDGGKVDLNLSGYRTLVRDELISVIAARAKLLRRGDGWLSEVYWARPGLVRAPFGARLVEAPPSGRYAWERIAALAPPIPANPPWLVAPPADAPQGNDDEIA